MKLNQGFLNAPLSEPPVLAPVPDAREHAFAFAKFSERRFHFRWHYHREVELVWIRSGKGMRYAGRSVEPFGPGDLVLLGPNVPHAWGSASDQSGKADWSVINFLPERWGNSFWQMAEAETLLKLIKRADGGLQFTGKRTEIIGELIESIAQMPPCSFGSLSVFMEVCRRLTETENRVLNAGTAPPVSFSSDPRFQRAITLIETRSNDRLSQAELAGQLQMSAATFSRWFRQRVGRTFQRYVNEVRVARVCADLAHREDNITTVAMNSGYNNLANFNRRFREIMGVTPKAFRAQARLLTVDDANAGVVRCAN